MSDFIREVDEGLRHDQFRRFLTRYWIALIILVVLVLASVGGWEAYDYLRIERAQVAGGHYIDALDLTRDGKHDEALADLQGVVADGTPGYRLLARFRLAGETGTKDKAAGAKLFDAIGADPAVDPALQNIARLRAGLLLLDVSSYADFKTRMAPLADANSPVRNAARELLALAALKADLPADAGSYLDAIETDPTTTGALRQRADAFQGLVRGAGKSAQPVSPAPTAPAPVAPVATMPAAPVIAPAPAAPAAQDAPQAPAATAPVSIETPVAPAATAAPAPDAPAASAPLVPAAPVETPAK